MNALNPFFAWRRPWPALWPAALCVASGVALLHPASAMTVEAAALQAGKPAHAASVTSTGSTIADLRGDELKRKVIEPSKTQPVVVEFHADWCGPCKKMAPKVEAMAQKFRGRMAFLRVDIDEEKALTKRLAVDGVPLIVVFSQGVALGRVSGDVKQDKLEQLLAAYLE